MKGAFIAVLYFLVRVASSMMCRSRTLNESERALVVSWVVYSLPLSINAIFWMF